MTEKLQMSCDHEETTETNIRYFVYDENDVVVYKGDFAQCLCVMTVLSTCPEMTLDELKDRTDGFI